MNHLSGDVLRGVTDRARLSEELQGQPRVAACGQAEPRLHLESEGSPIAQPGTSIWRACDSLDCHCHERPKRSPRINPLLRLARPAHQDLSKSGAWSITRLPPERETRCRL